MESYVDVILEGLQPKYTRIGLYDINIKIL